MAEEHLGDEDLPHVPVDETGGWDATHEAAAAAAAAAHAAAHAANLGQIQEDHQEHSTADPVLAAATAAAMDAAGAPAADESATEAAVAVASTLPDEEAEEAVVDHQEHHQHEEHHVPEHGHIVPGGVAGTKTRKNFDERLKELKRYKLKHGHCNIPHKYSANPQLGTWVDTQRRLYRASKRHPNKATTLTQENIDRLVDIGFNFEPRPTRDETWNNRLAELAAFKRDHGHCNVREDDQAHPGLGKWVSYVRRTYRLMRQGRRGKNSRRLDQNRLAQLRDIGFVFELREEMAHKRFREGIAALHEFIDEHGHASVPNFYEKNPTLGLVIEEMKREAVKLQMGQPSTMNEEMMAELIEIGIVGDPGSIEDPAAHSAAPIHGDDQAEVTAAAAAAAAAADVMRPAEEHDHDPNEDHEHIGATMGV